jgi:hypothetical protein
VSQIAVAGGTAWRDEADAGIRPAGQAIDVRRALQLALAASWLLDGLLQYQPYMFSKSFSTALSVTALGNPAAIARPITWGATLLGNHLVPLNFAFAGIQVLIGLGIAFRPTARVALAGSVGWAIVVWWFGEGLGGVLSGAASPLNGAPGAVILYALLAVLLWPADRAAPAPFAAARAIGAPAARALWLVLWTSLASFALTPANRAPQALYEMIIGMGAGEPAWLRGIDTGAARLVSGQGLAASIGLAAALALIAIGVYLPPAAARRVLVVALGMAAVIWVVGEAFGMIMAGQATDPNSGPLLAMLALAYWPARTVAPSAALAETDGEAA